MTFLRSSFLAVLLCLFAHGVVRADERILDYDVLIRVQPDASLEVTEAITVYAERNQIRRGIYRDFPTRYRDRAGNAVVVDLEVIGVERNGQPEPWFTERRSNGIRINTGDDDFLPAPAKHRFVLRYRTNRQLGFFPEHDELYFNAIGTGWAFPVDAGRVEVRLPAPVPVADMRAEGYTGPQGSTAQDYRVVLPEPGVARWLLTRPLPPQAGMTVVLAFPKGLVPEPSAMQRIGWLLKDNRGVLIAVAGLLILLGYCLRRWLQVGRDPVKGVIIARYEPPEGHGPAGLRYLRRMSYDSRCFSSDLLAMAVAGQIEIERDKGLLKEQWQLHRTDVPASAVLTAAQRNLLDRLFKGSRRDLELHHRNASTVSAARRAHTEALDSQYQPALFKRNGGSVGVAFLIAAASIVPAFVLSGGSGIPLIIAAAVLMLLTVLAFTALVRAPTPAGRRLLDEIEGLKLYLGVAERDELKNLPGPDAPPVLDARRYELLLPYAVALEVEDAWTKKFTVAVGAAAAAAATAGIAWYRGGGFNDVGALSQAVGNSLSSSIASASSPPGSSSGGGGGGSSGGGGGGGGGGGR